MTEPPRSELGGALGDDAVEIEIEAAQGTAAIGRVVDAGARSAVLRGRRVLVGPIDPCGECEVCRRGGATVCPLATRREARAESIDFDPQRSKDRNHLTARVPLVGTIGNRVIASGRWVVVLGDGLELPMPGGAAVAGDVAIAYTLYARTGLGPRDPVVVVGASSIARFLVEILLAKEITPTVVADASAVAWCDWLVAKGAAVARVTVAIDSTGDPAPRPTGVDPARGGSVPTTTPGRFASLIDDVRATVVSAIAAQGNAARPQKDEATAALRAKPWRVIATSPDAVALAAQLAGPRATLTVLAPTPDLPGELVSREVTVIGVAGAHPDLVVEAAAMCVKGEIDLVDGTSTTRNDVMRAIVSVH